MLASAEDLSFDCNCEVNWDLHFISSRSPSVMRAFSWRVNRQGKQWKAASLTYWIRLQINIKYFAVIFLRNVIIRTWSILYPEEKVLRTETADATTDAISDFVSVLSHSGLCNWNHGLCVEKLPIFRTSWCIFLNIIVKLSRAWVTNINNNIELEIFNSMTAYSCQEWQAKLSKESYNHSILKSVDICFEVSCRSISDLSNLLKWTTFQDYPVEVRVWSIERVTWTLVVQIGPTVLSKIAWNTNLPFGCPSSLDFSHSCSAMA